MRKKPISIYSANRAGAFGSGIDRKLFVVTGAEVTNSVVERDELGSSDAVVTEEVTVFKVLRTSTTIKIVVGWHIEYERRFYRITQIVTDDNGEAKLRLYGKQIR